MENQLAFDDDGDFDYEAMADNTGGLRTLLEYTASLADDPKRNRQPGRSEAGNVASVRDYRHSSGRA